MKILVVDDDSSVLAVACQTLRILGHESVSADGVIQARQLLDEAASSGSIGRFDGVISDLRMNGVEKAGFEFLSDVKKKFPGTWTIQMSGNFPLGLQNEAAAVRILCLDKPFSFATLKWAIDHVSSTP